MASPYKQETYRYRPLKNSPQEMRLLHLSSRNTNNENQDTSATTLIECALTHAKIDDRPDYIALSYTWGDPNKTVPIIMDGHTVQVTENLHQALFHFQHPNKSLTLWIDALCINQPDLVEKSAQVKLMTDIYTNASRVHIWLGPASDSSATALAQLQSLGDILIPFTKLREDISSGAVPRQMEDGLKTTRNEAILFAQTMDYDALEALLWERPWWRRVWVIQEAVLAREAHIFCGVDSISWGTFLSVLQVFIWLGIQPVLLGKAASKEEKVRSLVVGLGIWDSIMGAYGRTGGKGLSLVEMILNSFQHPHTLATDPRDRIYGLLGMARKEDREKIPVDYSADMTLAKVLFFTMKVLLEEYGPDLLCYCVSNSLSGSLPSWVPNWTEASARKIGGFKIRSQPLFSAGKDRQWDARSVKVATFEAPAIEVLALVVSRIVNVGDRLTSAAEDPRDISQCRAWLEAIEQLLESVHSELNDETSFQFQRSNLWRLPIADQAMAKRADQTPACCRGYCAIRGDNVPSGQTQGDGRDWILRESWIYRRYWRALSRLPFVTADGKVGLGPDTLRVDDQICVFAGGSVPFVIRDIGNERFSLIGEAYVQGLMDGEACSEQAMFQFIHII